MIKQQTRSRNHSKGATDALFGRLMAGLRKKYGQAKPELLERLRYELNVINSIKGTPYLLFLAEAAGLAARLGIRFRCSGKANASLVFYCLGITSLDPIRYGLLFEGFINPGQGCFPEIKIEINVNDGHIINMEDAAINKLLRRFKPKTFDDLCALIALRHPLLAKQAERYFLQEKARQKHPLPHPALDAVLGETRGVFVYEEQVLRILQMAGGLTLSQALESLRKLKGQKTGIGKSVFLANTQKRGLVKNEALAIFEAMLKIAPFIESRTVAIEFALTICHEERMYA